MRIVKSVADVYIWNTRGNYELWEFLVAGVESFDPRRNSNRRMHVTDILPTLMDESSGSEKEFVAL